MGLEGIPRVRNLSFNNIKMAGQRLLWVTSISPDKPVENLTVSNVMGTCRNAINVANIKNLILKSINVTGFEGDFIRTNNVTGPDIEKIKQPSDTMAG